MRLTVRLLGTEVFHFSTEPDEPETEACDYTSQPVGFVASPGDQRWESSPTYE